jgi:hypothetical protein
MRHVTAAASVWEVDKAPASPSPTGRSAVAEDERLETASWQCHRAGVRRAGLTRVLRHDGTELRCVLAPQWTPLLVLVLA